MPQHQNKCSHGKVYISRWTNINVMGSSGNGSNCDSHNKCVPGNVYISGWSALNMMDPTGNSGDWHPRYLMPKNLKYAGEGCEINTLPWLGIKGILTYPNIYSMPEWCQAPGYWEDFTPPYIVASHKRAAVDLLYMDYVVRTSSRGKHVDMYAWMDEPADIQEIMDDFEVIIDALADTPQRVDRALWDNWKITVWDRFE